MEQSNNLNGFTLVELLVSIFIILLISGILFTSYRQSEGQLTLQRAANKLAQDIRRAQEMAMSAKECEHPVACPGGGVPAGGYGLYIDKFIDDSYIIYADDGSSPKSEEYTTGEEIEIIYLDQEIYIEDFIPSSANFSINFKPPDPTIKIKNQAGEDKNNVTIIIALRTNPSKTKTIRANKAGLIDVD